MKIAFLLTQSLESPSGLGRYGPLARELAKRGHHVAIHALHPDFESLERKCNEQDGVLVNYAAPMHVRKSGSEKTYYPPHRLLSVAAGAAVQLARAAVASQAEIIHIGKPHPMNSLAGLAGKHLSRARLFLDCDDYEAGSGHFQQRWQKRSVAWFEQWMPRRVEWVTTNTRYMKSKLEGWGVPSEQIFHLPNGVERSRFAPPDPEKVNQLRSSLQLEGKQVVAFIGSLSLASHPVDLLVEAFAILASRLPEAALLLVGGGEDYHTLQYRAEALGIDNRVRFAGRIAPGEVVSYYHLADVSVDPVHDNQAARGRSPLKLFESWACRVPFITSGVGDRALLLGDPPAGLMAEPGNAASLAKTVERLLTDEKLAEIMVQRGWERVQDYYWDQLAGCLEALYLEKPEEPLNRRDTEVDHF